MRYGSGNCAGYYYIDKFTYPGYNQFSCIFGAAQTTNFNVIQGDGIIGLSRNYQQPSLSFIHSIKNALISNSLSFSLKFNIINNQIVGKMVIGTDSDFYQQNIVTCPLITLSVNPIFWACSLSYFGFKSAKASQTFNAGYGVIFDTGTNNILLPMQSFEEVKKLANGVVGRPHVAKVLSEKLGITVDEVFKLTCFVNFSSANQPSNVYPAISG